MEKCDDLISRQCEDVARNMIGEMPAVEPETHDKRTETHACDSISRQAAIDELDKFIQWCDKALRSPHIESVDAFAVKVERASLKRYREVLELLEPAQPERKRGKWIKVAESIGICMYKCSECGMGSDFCFPFCLNCGADMRGEQNE